MERSEGYSSGRHEFADTSVEAVMKRMAHPDRCLVRKGFFPETAEGLEDRFAFVSIDTDLYQPIYDGLKYFYPRLVAGGCVFIHDYNHKKFAGAGAAIRKFSEEAGVHFLPIPDTAGSAVIQKQAA